MDNQKKAIIVLCGIAAAVIILFIMGVSINIPDRPVSADDFDPRDFPVFGFISDILGRFAPKLQENELRQLAFPPRTFRVDPSDEEMRNAEFCVTPLIPQDRNAMTIIHYQASRAEDRFEDLRNQTCTVSVRDTERFPSCCNMIMLQSSGELRFTQIRGNVSVRLRDTELFVID
ncbi:hypothetical protein QA601_03315 [Chitinispirillales bacterium ANBcel5]|uniref:hypothetical protein n=1 Tax=Cellulosispirillum alkaliphilum TaxID=3039283 RepID=UPI002A522266|nr:hypothetical protein [Chitinispirillales bacterium ANBcel5]